MVFGHALRRQKEGRKGLTPPPVSLLSQFSWRGCVWAKEEENRPPGPGEEAGNSLWEGSWLSLTEARISCLPGQRLQTLYLLRREGWEAEGEAKGLEKEEAG